MARGGVEWGWGLGTEVSLIWKLPSSHWGLVKRKEITPQWKHVGIP